MTRVERVAVAVVGAGPAGLTAAAALARSGTGPVVVLEREQEPGGIPRHSDHPGFGIRDLRRSLTGPQYARRLARAAVDAGVAVRVGATVTGWAGDRSLEVTSTDGRARIDADAVVLATGARERPRSARWVAGDRPAGVLTTGQLQNLVHRGLPVGTRAVVVGAELVSWSAVLTLRAAGCAIVAMVSAHDRAEAYAPVTWVGRLGLRVPVVRATRVTRVVGRDRVSGVELLDDRGRTSLVACDTVIFTGDWIPDNELARMRGLEIDPGHRGPLVDTALRTSAPGVFAAGNLLHPVDTADVAAIDGRHVARQVSAHLTGAPVADDAVRVRAGVAFAWVAPGLVRPGDPAPPRGRLLLWPFDRRLLPTVVVRQGSVELARSRVPWPVAPGRPFRVPWQLVASARPGDGDVTIDLA